ncbi:TetR/AcrR family transcriptional regulator [Paenibacillus hunanensis]|uniref:TetR/AcrR family fatty acid metabolism transcriptional regulator n=1 Tax=Paenibacillus hunanensis TaxID=539262 RepID=A0ABU1J5H7_9BACL|nr:TetR/AcrR family transcriptional regulator [Paenibacillus hunanensis]MCL9663168.1 TetR/AcrR family transcriptional regulator [Paenibacillus hunanensis]MDR6246711.1 TetR/AcrR family fatty acid metabolism transcriptional regulator [Paenibacillus hunanensis]GGJ32757.1 TetR family transcriptional regulator [Paenibacillus hunanensis]
MSGTTGDKLDLILDAAYELFGVDGFYETKISDIANRAGIAKGTVYLYFKSKEELCLAVTRRDCEQFLDNLHEALRPCTNMADKLYVIAVHHTRYHFERRKYTKLVFRAPNNDPALMQYMRQFMFRYMEIVLDVLKEGKVAHPQWSAESYIGMLDRVKMDLMFNPDFNEQQLQERTRFVTDLFLMGCEKQINRPGDSS